MENIIWEFLDNQGIDIEAKVQHMINLLKCAYLQSFPEKKFKVTSDQAHIANWFNNDVKGKRGHLYFLYEKLDGSTEMLNSAAAKKVLPVILYYALFLSQW